MKQLSINKHKPDSKNRKNHTDVKKRDIQDIVLFKNITLDSLTRRGKSDRNGQKQLIIEYTPGMEH
jgi:hypothetical protein